jgi:hypothetical protein
MLHRAPIGRRCHNPVGRLNTVGYQIEHWRVHGHMLRPLEVRRHKDLPKREISLQWPAGAQPSATAFSLRRLDTFWRERLIDKLGQL